MGNLQRYPLDYDKADGYSKRRNEIDKIKAHWIVMSNLQRYSLDYDKASAPTVWVEHLRFFIALTIAFNLKIHQMDV